MLIFYFDILLPDDSWMDITPGQLDEMMVRSSGLNPSSVSSDTFDLSNVAESMKSFVEKVSSHEGAEFPR